MKNNHARRNFIRKITVGASGLAFGGGMMAFTGKPEGQQKLSTTQTKQKEYAGTVVRRNIASLPVDDPSVKLLKDAVRLMKERSAVSPLEPTGWDAHGALHSTFCATNYYPNQVHYNWFVWPWHRLYLWSLEKKLQRIVGEPKLALHYWDWTKTRRIPEHYWGEKNPLYNNTRLVLPKDEIPTDFIDVGAALRAPKYFTFGGHPHVRQEGEPQIDGIAEHSFHNNIHNWIGGDMASFVASGYDPIFYAHHGNCDRIWAAWQAYDTNHANPTEEDWLEKTLFATDAKGKPMQMKIRELLDTDELGYKFEDLDLNPTFCNPFTDEMCPPKGQRNPDMEAQITIAANDRSNILRSMEQRDRFHVMLHFERVQLPYMPYCGRVFFDFKAGKGFNEPQVTKYIGTITMLPIVAPDSALLEKEVYMQLEVDGIVADAIRNEVPINITMEPVQLRGRNIPDVKLKLKDVKLKMA